MARRTPAGSGRAPSVPHGDRVHSESSPRRFAPTIASAAARRRRRLGASPQRPPRLGPARRDMRSTPTPNSSRLRGAHPPCRARSNWSDMQLWSRCRDCRRRGPVAGRAWLARVRANAAGGAAGISERDRWLCRRRFPGVPIGARWAAAASATAMRARPSSRRRAVVLGLYGAATWPLPCAEMRPAAGLICAAGLSCAGGPQPGRWQIRIW